MDSDQNEIARLKREVARLQAQLKTQQAPSDLAQTLITNTEFLTDMARFAEGLASEKDIRKKHRLAESDWERLGSDEAFIEAIKRERERRVRNGATARERAQKIFTETPEVLGNILNDDDASARHRIEAAREIRAVASVGPEVQSPAERFVITINLGADQVLRFNKPITPGIDDDGRVIERKAIPMIEDDN